MINQMSDVVERLQDGQIGVFPAKNGYMLVGSGSQELYQESSERIRDLKRKKVLRPLARVASVGYVMDVIQRCAPTSVRLVERNMTEPIIWSVTTDELPENVHNIPEVGLAIARSEYELSVTEGLGGPIIASSANVTGQSTPTSVDSIHPAIRNRVDFTVDIGTLPTEADFGVLRLPDLWVHRHSLAVGRVLEKEDY